jgi:tRNA(Ile2) C34 agmatinyltransferase TiaS
LPASVWVILFPRQAEVFFTVYYGCFKNGCGQGGDMRRLTVKEEIQKDQPVIEDVKAICALCGAQLEKDEESGEYRCAICDNDEGN